MKRVPGGQLKHSVCPVPLVVVPAGHGVHTPPSTDVKPTGHSVQLVPLVKKVDNPTKNLIYFKAMMRYLRGKENRGRFQLLKTALACKQRGLQEEEWGRHTRKTC